MKDDTEPVKWLLVWAKDQGLSDEEAGALIGGGRSAVGLWRKKVENGEPVVVHKKAVRRALISLWRANGGVAEPSKSERTPGMVISEIRARLTELEGLVGSAPDVSRETARLIDSSAKQSTDALSPKKSGRKGTGRAG